MTRDFASFLAEARYGDFDLALIACAAAAGVCFLFALPVQNPRRRTTRR